MAGRKDTLHGGARSFFASMRVFTHRNIRKDKSWMGVKTKLMAGREDMFQNVLNNFTKHIYKNHVFSFKSNVCIMCIGLVWL
jgi:hypothetical protein